MAWLDDLRPASFRGVQFKIDSVEVKFGRRGVIHKYPQRDDSWVEDLGKEPREFTIRAYVIGPDYINQRDRLIDAVELKSEPGELVTPTHQSIQVTPLECRVGFSNAEGGIEYFDLTFIQSGSNRFPDQTNDTRSTVINAGNTTLNTVKSIFGGVFNTTGLPDFVGDDAETKVNDLLDLLRSSSGLRSRDPDAAASLLAEIDSIGAQIASLLASPSDLADGFVALAEQIQGVYPNASDAFVAYESLYTYGDDYPEVTEVTTTRAQQAANQRAIVGLAKRVALVGLAKTAADVDFASYDDAVGLRDDLAQRIDDALLGIGATDEDQAYFDLAALRAEMVADVTSRAANLRRIQNIPLASPLPALAVAYDVYQNATYDAEIVARNRVRHPGFIPNAAPVQVLV